MTIDEIIEYAMQNQASPRDAVRWAILQERIECVKAVDKACGYGDSEDFADIIYARGQQ